MSETYFNQRAAFTIPEAEVAHRVGLSRVELKNRRGARGARWEVVGRSIHWSVEGVGELEKELASAAHAAAEPEVEEVPTQEFEVARVRTDSVLHVVADGEVYDPRLPRLVWIPKKMAALFTPRMRLLARPRPGNELLWDFCGNPEKPQRGARMPRRRGHW